MRAVLYMGALVATHCNPVIRDFYQRLLAAGKLKKLALTACMRKLLVILNSMLRHRSEWCDLSGQVGSLLSFETVAPSEKMLMSLTEPATSFSKP